MATLVNYTCKSFIKLTPGLFYRFYLTVHVAFHVFAFSSEILLFNSFSIISRTFEQHVFNYNQLYMCSIVSFDIDWFLCACIVDFNLNL